MGCCHIRISLKGKHMKKIFGFMFDSVGKMLFIAFGIMLVACGLYAITNDSYTAGKNSVQPQFVEQTLAIMNLNSQNSELKNQVVLMQGENYALRILTQTQEEELDSLKSTVSSLNQSIVELESDNANLDEIILKLNSDVTYLNSYVNKLENTITSLKNSYVVLILPQEFSKAPMINSYYYIDKVYLQANSVDDMYVCNLTDNSWTTCNKTPEVSYGFASGSYVFDFIKVWKDLLLFNRRAGPGLFGVDINTNDILTIYYGSMKSSSIILEDCGDYIVFGVNKYTVLYDYFTQATLKLTDDFDIYSRTIVSNNSIIILTSLHVYSVNIFDFTYIEYSHSNGFIVDSFKYDENYIFFCLYTTGSRYIYSIHALRRDNLERVGYTEVSSPGWNNSAITKGFVLAGNRYYAFGTSAIHYFDISTFKFVTITLSDISFADMRMSFIVFDNCLVFVAPSPKGLYRVPYATDKVELIDANIGIFTLNYQKGDSCLFTVNSKNYVYNATTNTLIEHSDYFKNLSHMADIDDYIYFGSSSGIVRFTNDFSSYEIFNSIKNTNPSVLKRYDDLILFVTSFGWYMFDLESLEVIEFEFAGSTVNYNSSRVVMAENGEDCYLHSSSEPIVYFFDYSERQLSVYSYGMDLT